MIEQQFATGAGGQGGIQPTPSQAEGDRDTVDRDLEEKGLA
jgi:hypothetical protein